METNKNNVVEQKDSIKLIKNSMGLGYEIKVYADENSVLIEKVKLVKSQIEKEFKGELVQVKKPNGN